MAHELGVNVHSTRSNNQFRNYFLDKGHPYITLANFCSFWYPTSMSAWVQQYTSAKIAILWTNPPSPFADVIYVWGWGCLGQNYYFFIKFTTTIFNFFNFDLICTMNSGIHENTDQRNPMTLEFFQISLRIPLLWENSDRRSWWILKKVSILSLVIFQLFRSEFCHWSRWQWNSS